MSEPAGRGPMSEAGMSEPGMPDAGTAETRATGTVVATSVPGTGRRPSTRRALPIRAELMRQVKRRRTQGIFIVLFLLPLILVFAFWIGGDDTGATTGPGRPSLTSPRRAARP